MSKPAIPKVTDSKTVHKGFFDVRIDYLTLHGHTLSYTVVDLLVDAVAILAKTADDKLLITREYRHPTGKWILGCPGGRIDPGESPLEAAERELLEETGYRGKKSHLLGEVYPLPAVSDQKIHFVLIEEISLQHPPTPEPFELIQTELKTKEEIQIELTSGIPIDGVFCTALFLGRIL
jgi:ADP-ribose pyrophosphatase